MDAHQLIPRTRPPWRLPLGLPLHQAGPIGVDFGTERLNLVQTERRDGRHRIRAAASVPYGTEREVILADRDRLRSLLRDSLNAHPFTGRRAIVALPASRVRLIPLTYSPAAGTDEAAAVARAVRERLGEQAGTALVDYLPIFAKGEDTRERTALVAVAERAAVVDFLESLRRCGLEVEALEVGPVAIKRLIATIDGGRATRKVLVITFGTLKSYATVLWGDGLLLDREVDFGMHGAVHALVESLEVPPREAERMIGRYGIAPGTSAAAGDGHSEIIGAISEILRPVFRKLTEELRRILIYTAAETRGGAVDTVYLLGSAARWPGIDGLLGALLEIPVTTINPFYGLDVRARAAKLDDLEPLSGIAVATGLALRTR